MDSQSQARFDDWYACGASEDLEIWVDELRASGAPAEAARRMESLLGDATAYAGRLPTELSAVITPIQQLLQQVCLKSVASLNKG